MQQDIQIGTFVDEETAGSTIPMLEQTIQQMLSADRGLPSAAAFGHGGLDDLAAVRSQSLVKRVGGSSSTYHQSDGGTQGAAVKLLVSKNASCRTVFLTGKAQKQMLAAYIAVPQLGGVGLSQAQSAQRGGGKSLFCHDATSQKYVSKTIPNFPENYHCIFQKMC